MIAQQNGSRCEDMLNFLPGSLPFRPKANVFAEAKGRYPENPLWGDGWGWALFKADSPDKQVATNYKKELPWLSYPR